MIVVFIVVLVVFGPQKLPELARSLGKLMAEFRKASTDFKSAFEEEMRDLERQTLLAERKKSADAAAAAATPSLPATLATPSGSETPPSDTPSEPGATEAPVIAPVAESIPHSAEGSAALQADPAVATDSRDVPHDTQQPA
jgi:sec-independent protein translocase protein TatB